MNQSGESRDDIALITPVYPTKGNLYSGAFIKSRSEFYTSLGYRVMVFVVTDEIYFESNSDFITQNETLECVSTQKLIQKLANTNCSRIFAHSLSSLTIKSLIESGIAARIIFWFHGFEVRNPMRLNYNFMSQESAVPLHKSRLNMVLANKGFIERREVLRDLFKSSQIKKVFVSKFLRNIAEHDVGVEIYNSVIIPNPIDTFFFSCRDKRDLTKVLFLRPFSAHNYGCDLMEEVVIKYNSLYPNTKVMFTICGDGPLHNKYTKGLAKYNNVVILKKFFDRHGIKALHEEHGTMLLPTRFDTQGITMGEAMSSEMVVITNEVAAIPEFTDNDSAILCPSEDIDSMVKALNKVEQQHLREELHKISKNARNRVLLQVSAKTVCKQELELA